jgi:uncharacterized protein YbjT (DUF2867 family)
MRVLLTGGTGHLGRAIAAGLTREGHRVRILARRPGDDPGVEWVQGDLSAAPDLGPALAGVDAVVHAATDSPAARRGGFRPLDPVRSPTGVDIDGTAALLAAAAKAPVGHFLHVSITGLGQAARISPYARVKPAAEELVMTSSVPWSILRASGFHWLLERMLARMARRPVLVLPGDVHMQPVDSDDVAGVVVACLDDGRRGEREDVVGPETLTMRRLAEMAPISGWRTSGSCPSGAAPTTSGRWWSSSRRWIRPTGSPRVGGGDVEPDRPRRHAPRVGRRRRRMVSRAMAVRVRPRGPSAGASSTRRSCGRSGGPG